ncbi:MAG: hypothetical protein JWM11_5535 [Planctomycetaceae bacterium]|nr:hypothetical protein [Planctomycetaceae bacterium]
MNTLRHFELLEDLNPFGNAKATLLKWNGEKYVRTNEEIEIFEFLGTFGVRRNRGLALHSDESKKWEAVGGMQEPAESWMPFM